MASADYCRSSTLLVGSDGSRTLSKSWPMRVVCLCVELSFAEVLRGCFVGKSMYVEGACWIILKCMGMNFLMCGLKFWLFGSW